MNAWIASSPASSRWRTIFLAILFEVSALAQSGGTVSGQIRLPDGSSAVGVRVGAMAVSVPGETGDAIVLDRIATTFGEDGRKIQRSGTAAAIPVGRNGGFSLQLQDGEYSISLITSTGTPLSPSDGYYVKSMTFGTADILGAKFRVAGSLPSSITITLAPGK
jgi:hypothetical protein